MLGGARAHRDGRRQRLNSSSARAAGRGGDSAAARVHARGPCSRLGVARQAGRGGRTDGGVGTLKGLWRGLWTDCQVVKDVSGAIGI